jgi:hypothetical protein
LKKKRAGAVTRLLGERVRSEGVPGRVLGCSLRLASKLAPTRSVTSFWDEEDSKTDIIMICLFICSE